MTRYISTLSLVFTLIGILLLFFGLWAIRGIVQNDSLIQREEEVSLDLNSSLVDASVLGHLERVQQLIKDRKISPNITDRLGRSPLLVSLESGHLSITEYLLRNGASANEVDTAGNSALMIAARHGRMEILNLLLEKGADINHQSKLRRTALYEAALSGEYHMVIKLINVGADVRTADLFGNTIIHAAVLSKNIPVLRLVIGTSVNIDTQNLSGITPLGLAVSHQLLAQAQVILENEGNPYLKDIEGENILTLAVRSDEMRSLRQMEEAREIESMGNLVIAKKIKDISLEDLRRTEEMVKILLTGRESDAFLINSRDKELRTPLMYAALNGNFLVVSQLIEAGAQLDLQDENGMSALHLATQSGYGVIVEDLITAGASLDMRNGQGRTPIQLAQDLGFRDIERTLTRQAEETSTK